MATGGINQWRNIHTQQDCWVWTYHLPTDTPEWDALRRYYFPTLYDRGPVPQCWTPGQPSSRHYDSCYKLSTHDVCAEICFQQMIYPKYFDDDEYKEFTIKPIMSMGVLVRVGQYELIRSIDRTVKPVVYYVLIIEYSRICYRINDTTGYKVTSAYFRSYLHQATLHTMLWIMNVCMEGFCNTCDVDTVLTHKLTILSVSCHVTYQGSERVQVVRYMWYCDCDIEYMCAVEGCLIPYSVIVFLILHWYVVMSTYPLMVASLDYTQTLLCILHVYISPLDACCSPMGDVVSTSLSTLSAAFVLSYRNSWRVVSIELYNILDDDCNIICLVDTSGPIPRMYSIICAYICNDTHLYMFSRYCSYQRITGMSVDGKGISTEIRKLLRTLRQVIPPIKLNTENILRRRKTHSTRRTGARSCGTRTNLMTSDVYCQCEYRETSYQEQTYTRVYMPHFRCLKRSTALVHLRMSFIYGNLSHATYVVGTTSPYTHASYVDLVMLCKEPQTI